VRSVNGVLGGGEEAWTERASTELRDPGAGSEGGVLGECAALNIRAITRHPVVSRAARSTSGYKLAPRPGCGWTSKSGGCERGGDDAEVAAGGAFAAGDAEVDGAVEDAWFAVWGGDDHGGGAAAVEVDGIVSA
jgi:hypothetical protein